MKATERQIGGNHYSRMAIQPAEFIHRNRLGWLEGVAIEYIVRHPFKRGREDVLKAIHTLELLLELEYPDQDPKSVETAAAEAAVLCRLNRIGAELD